LIAMCLRMNMNANERFLNEARELEKRWEAHSTAAGPDTFDAARKDFRRSAVAADLECHRLPGEAVCEDCEELASFSRRTHEPNPRGNFISYYCSIHAPEDAGCFVVKEARHKFK